MARAASPIRPIARLGTLIIIAVIAIVLLGLTVLAWRSIAPGYVGIVFDKANHNVTAGALEPGWAFINPFTQAIQQYPITIQTYSMVQKTAEGQTAGDDSIKVQSNEGQQLNLDIVIQYQVIKEEAGALYQDWGGADITTVQDQAVRQYTRSQVPVVASKYTWEEITSSKRAEIVNEISQVLTAELAKRHLRLISMGVREVHLPQSLQTALDQKIQAQQQAE
ncbi:MAG TPA: SPFH domain-containing protein, partial [Roseiflexaceae bacterium]